MTYNRHRLIPSDQFRQSPRGVDIPTATLPVGCGRCRFAHDLGSYAQQRELAMMNWWTRPNRGVAGYRRASGGTEKSGDYGSGSVSQNSWRCARQGLTRLATGLATQGGQGAGVLNPAGTTYAELTRVGFLSTLLAIISSMPTCPKWHHNRSSTALEAVRSGSRRPLHNKIQRRLATAEGVNQALRAGLGVGGNWLLAYHYR